MLIRPFGISTDNTGQPRFTQINGAGTSNYFYNSLGQLTREAGLDGFTRLYGYNTRGEQMVMALDMNGNKRNPRANHSTVQASVPSM